MMQSRITAHGLTIARLVAAVPYACVVFLSGILMV